MKLTSKKAYELLLEAKEMYDGPFFTHSIKVGEAAARISEKLNLDVDKAKAMGYIHDIGKRYGEPLINHPIQGYEFMKELGYDKEYVDICLTHSYLNNDITCTAALLETPDSYMYEFKKDFIENHKYTMYDKIINLCDLMCTSQFATLEERLINIMIRIMI